MDRLSNGDQWTPLQIAEVVAGYYNDWRGIRIVATILAESGGWTWIRPMVLNETSKAHLSTDRGICQWNSYWHPEVPDAVAFDPVAAIEHMCHVATTATWELDLSPWHGSTSMEFYNRLPAARAAMNEVRARTGLPAI